MRHPHTRGRLAPGLTALALATSLLVGLVPGLVAGGAHADDPTCVGKGEYKQIRGGMSIQRLADLLDGQTPFADLEGRARQRVRWYAACDTWQPVKDVVVRYHQPVVGRRTVAGKRLAVYEVTPAPSPDPKGGSGSQRRSR